MRTKIVDVLRRAVGTKSIVERLDRVERQLRVACQDASPPLDLFEVLPGTEYARYAIPVDYPPSREFTARYGYSRGRIEALETWFTKHTDDYLRMFDYLRTLRLDSIPTTAPLGASATPAWIGGAICAFDALMLYGMLQQRKPKTYLEIGSGMTTCFARQAVKDARLATRIISIDPSPRSEIDAICDEVIRCGLESYDLTALEQLNPGDILFFDGSHRTYMNSDVTVFFIDVLPRLKPGVIVHVHDIFLPWDYPESYKNWYWNEQYMLAVYLMNAMDRLTPLAPTTWLCRSPLFEAQFTVPPVDLGSDEANRSWRGGGSMWFTKKE